MLEFKKISEDTLEVMEDAIGSNKDYYPIATENINNLLGGKNIHILNSANSCLLVIAEKIEEPVLVVDQGGWKGFIKSCEIFDKKIEYITTDDGLINIEILNKYFEEHDIKTFYITSLSGYTAKQPLKEIQEVCDIHNVLLIVDISGSVGDGELNKYGDIQVSSTGSPKIVNVENGGFINDVTGKLELNKYLLKTLKADNITCAAISNEIEKAVEIEEKTIWANRYLKNILFERLSDDEIHNIIHPHSLGLNTMITVQSKSKAKKLAYNIRQRLEINGNIITTGPNYNRIKKASIIIEVKNLDVESLTQENMDYLGDIIIEEIGKE
ncbi:MAG: cell wall biogenesis protein [Methanosphaera stadtmanae]|nr:cell wall biogenesis protein [Methanosphaera stadtmanae]